MQNNSIKSQFLLDSSVTYLAFGSFGSCPKPIFEEYQKWQLELEREPAQFITVNGLNYLKNRARYWLRLLIAMQTIWYTQQILLTQ